jgi:hypothetical protein
MPLSKNIYETKWCYVPLVDFLKIQHTMDYNLYVVE